MYKYKLYFCTKKIAFQVISLNFPPFLNASVVSVVFTAPKN